MKFIETELPGVIIIEPDVYGDDRGFFLESYSYRKYMEGGVDCIFVQDNHSLSKKRVVRGLHYTALPGQAKLIRCTRGKIWDVAVDIRPNSPTFRKWIGVELSADNFKQIFIPVGYAHGFSVLSDIAEVQYKVSSYYNPKLERGIFWADPDIGVDWRVENPILSERDKNNPTLREVLDKYGDPFDIPV